MAKASGLAFVDDALELHALRTEFFHRIFHRALQLETDRGASFARPRVGWHRLVRRVQSDGQALAALDAGPVVAETIGQLEPEGLAIELHRAIHVGHVNAHIAASEPNPTMPHT